MDNFLQREKQNIINDLAKFIAFKSVEAEADGDMPFGKEVHGALLYALDLSKKEGLSAVNMDNMVGYADWGNADKMLGILAHVDVVPEGDGWATDPYTLTIKDGKWIGRGVLDDKGPIIQALYAIKYLKEQGIVPKKTVRIIFGTNEESGWKGIDYYLEKEKTPDMAFTPDAEYPVIFAEQGITMYKLSFDGLHPDIKKLKGGNAANMVPDKATAVVVGDYNFEAKDDFIIEKNGNETTITCKGFSAHGSLPELGVNAVSKLLIYLSGYINDAFLNFYSEHIGMDYNGERINLELEDEQSGKLVFNVGVLDSNNVIVNLRYPISYTNEEIQKRFRKITDKYNFLTLECDSNQNPLYVPKDSEIVQKLTEAYIAVVGKEGSEPIAMAGGTYARSMKNAVAFGPLFPGEEDTCHQKNEYLSEETFLKGIKVMAEAIKRLVV